MPSGVSMLPAGSVYNAADLIGKTLWCDSESDASSTGSKSASKNTAILMKGVCEGDLAAVRRWVSSGLPSDEGDGDIAVQAVLERHMAPLNHAVFLNHGEIVRVLLEAKASPGSAEHIECHPLRVAVEMSHPEPARQLLKHGARIEPGLLGVAVAKGQVEIVDLLLDHGAHIDGRDCAPRVLTPLMVAAYHGDAEILSHLLERRAAPNVGHAEHRTTALNLAETRGNTACVQLLESSRLPTVSSIGRSRAQPARSALTNRELCTQSPIFLAACRPRPALPFALWPAPPS